MMITAVIYLLTDFLLCFHQIYDVAEDNKAFCVSTSGAHCAVSTLRMELYTWSIPGDPSGNDGFG